MGANNTSCIKVSDTKICPRWRERLAREHKQIRLCIKVSYTNKAPLHHEFIKLSKPHFKNTVKKTPKHRNVMEFL